MFLNLTLATKSYVRNIIVSYDCDFSNQTPLLINFFTKKYFSKTVFYAENNVNPGKKTWKKR
jgi:hypothetical protein